MFTLPVYKFFYACIFFIIIIFLEAMFLNKHVSSAVPTVTRLNHRHRRS